MAKLIVKYIAGHLIWNDCLTLKAPSLRDQLLIQLGYDKFFSISIFSYDLFEPL